MSAPGVLDRIAESTRVALAERAGREPLDELRRSARAAPVPRDFTEPFRRAEMAVIAEIKFRSPSEGELRPGGAAEAVRLARDYLRAGAAALSVLTESAHFGGSLGNLAAVRAAFPHARLLMKDFVVDERQLLEARRAGADAVLLIVRLLGETRTAELRRAAEELGMTALIEAHDEAELGAALRAGARLLGVNSRDLGTMEVSMARLHALAERAPAGIPRVAESGIRSGADLRALRCAGFGGFLIGTALMRQPDPGAALAALLREA
jgi:indole-3-glycerol phosphate synthase